MTLQTTNSPFNEEQVTLLNQLLPTLSAEQKLWLSGYIAAAQASSAPAAAPSAAPAGEEVPAPVQTQAPARTVTILVASQTGNGQALGEELKEKLSPAFSVTLAGMESFKPKSIKDVEDLLVIASTHGDGDPPDNAIDVYDFLFSKRAPQLPNVRFSVLSLGDSSYEFFCQTGKEFDQRFEELGAERFYPRVDCDVDYEDDAASWFEGIRTKLEAESVTAVETADSSAAVTEAEKPKHSKKNPFEAEILENINLNGRGSLKETRHLELDLEGANLAYEPGDSLGIIPENDPQLVDEIIDYMDWNPEELLTVGKENKTLPLREALISFYDITTISKPILEKLSAYSKNDAFTSLLEDTEERKAYIDGRDFLDLCRDFEPWTGNAKEVTAQLRPLAPRLYSIASSAKANPDEVHLTIGALRYDAHGRDRSGVCSVQCAERTEAGDKLPVFVQSNPNFKLPGKAGVPIIMIGAGTGIAPYRSFLEEREALEDVGKSWIFFGEQHFVTDFLYQTEWQKWLKEGVLTKMDVAFSRDQEEKVYVQHRLKQQGEQLYEWLQEGAHVYVCGDEKKMAKDVHEALVDVVEEQRGVNREEAETYIAELRQQKRYQRDVY